MYTDTTAKIKLCVAHADCTVTAIVDPLLTLSLPANLTAWTGMDALTHAIEAFSVDSFHPMCDGIALQSLLMIDKWLPIAYADGANVEARAQMLTASSMAAVAFQKGLGATHGLSEPIGAVFNTQHGLTNAIVLPHVLRANRPAIEAKCDLLARYLNLPPAPAGYGAGGGFGAVCFWVDTMSTELNIPASLADIGVNGDTAAAELSVKAFNNPTGFTNPIRFSAEEYEGIFKDSLKARDRTVY
jgi:alcohol dehydrogenase class IV